MNADADKKINELADARNVADSLIYTAEKSLAEHAAKIPDEVKQTVMNAVASVQTAKEGTDVAALTSASQTLSTEMQKIGEAVQKAGGPSTGSGQAGPETPPSPETPPTQGPVTDV